MATQQEELLTKKLSELLLLLLQITKCLEVRKQQKQHTKSWGSWGGSRSRAEVLLLQSLLIPLPSSNTQKMLSSLSFCQAAMTLNFIRVSGMVKNANTT